ncbi:MAG: LacI family DNA-binding transcriptional regulator [Lentisphaeria bacterium]|jgi:LacI family transcriptional regulator
MAKRDKKAANVSLGDIARAAAVSRAAVCYALRHSPGVSAATRQRILAIANRLGYAPDPRIAAQMATVRDAKAKDLLPIAWLNASEEEDSWRKYQFHLPYLEGAHARAWELGYRLEEIWIHEPGLTEARLARMLDRRGIEGAIITYPAKHIHLDWRHLAGVSLESDLLAPRLCRIMKDNHYNFFLAIKMLRRAGYRRIGVCLEKGLDRQSPLRSAISHFGATTPTAEQVPPLFYAGLAAKTWRLAKPLIAAWVAATRPEVVVGLDSRLVECLAAAGHRVPEEIGVVLLATDDDVADWAGICSNRRQIGATAVEQVVALMRSRQFGVPAVAADLLIRGTWHPGRTLLLPRALL